MNESIFAYDNTKKNDNPFLSSVPLAARVRPNSFDNYIGQKHLLGENKLLKKAIDSDTFSSIILHGPPGVGKTTLAELISRKTKSEFIRLSGVISKVTDLRKEIENAIKLRRTYARKTIIFIDEIHRFNRAQQDSLLPDIENGNIRFIGATTLNPNFHLVSPLLSRSLIFQLKPLLENEIDELIRQTIHDERAFANVMINISDEAISLISKHSEGDARSALNYLEYSVITAGIFNDQISITPQTVEQAVQKKSINYGEDGHYDTISAFIKSMRGSDPDAAIYWLAKMLSAGEDIIFIARRIVIFASEDIGNADPQALQVAVSAMQSVSMIGMPEARIILAQAVTYCATAPKSNASYVAINSAMQSIIENRISPIPVYLKSKPCKNSDEETGESYVYPHNNPNHISDQSYMGINAEFYKPADIGFERKIKERMKYWSELKKKIDEN